MTAVAFEKNSHIAGHVLCEIVEQVQQIAKVQYSLQTPPSYEEKQSGESSQISWAGAHFCNSVTQKYFTPNSLKKGTDTLVEIQNKNVNAVREMPCNNSRSHTLIGAYLPLMEFKLKKFDFVHQTVSCWELHVGWA